MDKNLEYTTRRERALEQREIIAKERQDVEGYARHPQNLEEIEEWESEQDWE